MTAYAWGSSSFGVDPQIVGESVQTLADIDGGACAPGRLVDVARDAESPLHSLFEWRDDVAADKYRTEQARRVIRSLRVVIDDPERRPPPAFVHVKIIVGENEVEGYADTLRVVCDTGLRAQALAEAMQLLRGLQRRYDVLHELAPLWAALDSLEAAGAAS